MQSDPFDTCDSCGRCDLVYIVWFKDENGIQENNPILTKTLAGAREFAISVMCYWNQCNKTDLLISENPCCVDEPDICIRAPENSIPLKLNYRRVATIDPIPVYKDEYLCNNII